MLTAVIPTRNRPDDLARAVASVCTQTRPPDELIIVDQSPKNDSRIQVEQIMFGNLLIKLNYIHDFRISGLVEAKRAGANAAKADIICFLEDDVILEADYLEQIEKGFHDQPGMIGCCGVVSNAPRYPFGYELIFHIFHRGIFEDTRVGLYGSFSGQGHPLIASKTLSGGLSAWRREVFSTISFDISNGFHMLEDIDFSTRVAAYYGKRLFINPNARLAHYPSPLNREMYGARQRRKLVEYFIFYKKRREESWATLSFIWLLLGLFFEALFQAFYSRTFDILQGFFAGIRDGFFKTVLHPKLNPDDHSS